MEATVTFYGRSLIENHEARHLFVMASQEFDMEMKRLVRANGGPGPAKSQKIADRWNDAELMLRDATVRYLEAVADSVSDATNGMDLNHFIRAPELHHRVAAE